jgi:hypothetical protein
MDFGWAVAQQEQYERILSTTRTWPMRPTSAFENGHFAQEGWRRCEALGLLGLSLSQESPCQWWRQVSEEQG